MPALEFKLDADVEISLAELDVSFAFEQKRELFKNNLLSTLKLNMPLRRKMEKSPQTRTSCTLGHCSEVDTETIVNYQLNCFKVGSFANFKC